MKTVEELAKEADDEFGGDCLGNAICGIEAIRRFRDLVLEEAAKVCDEVHERYPTDIFPDGESVDAQSAKMARITSNNCAQSIRAMKGQK